MNDLTNFDPIKVADEIAALETEAQDSFTAAKGVYISRSEIIAAKLWDVSQHHPEHLDAVCERAGIGTSRRYELLQIGGGRKTLAQSRQETAARQKKFKAKKKAKQLAAAEAAKNVSVTTPKVTEKAAKQSKATTDRSAGRPKPTPTKSAKSLAEFKTACDIWLPHLTECDKVRAVNYVQVRTGKLPESELMAS